MKTLLIILFVVICLSFIGCKGDDELPSKITYYRGPLPQEPIMVLFVLLAIYVFYKVVISRRVTGSIADPRSQLKPKLVQIHTLRNFWLDNPQGKY